MEFSTKRFESGYLKVCMQTAGRSLFVDLAEDFLNLPHQSVSTVPQFFKSCDQIE